MVHTHADLFLFTTASRTALGPTQPPIQWVPGALSLAVKQPEREADHLSPSSAEVKNAWSYTSTPPIRLHGVVLSSAQGQLYLLPLHTHTCSTSFTASTLKERNHISNEHHEARKQKEQKLFILISVYFHSYRY
jgi:hypothetical protein